MAKFLLPFAEGRFESVSFSPTAMVVSAVALAIIVSLQTSILTVFLFITAVFVGGTIASTRWNTVFSLAAKFEIIILFLVLIEPFIYGTTPAATFSTPIGQIVIFQEGIELGILLGLRMVALILIFLSTLSHMTLTEFIGALKTLRVPSLMLGSLLIMLRYVPLFLEERGRMQDALALRGLQRTSRLDRAKSLGFMIGSTIDRAFGRSITVFEAMKLRGFGKGMNIQETGFNNETVSC
jgi:cobalt/nickel transport system permease protein